MWKQETGKNKVKEDRGNVDVGRIRQKTSKLKICLPALARCGTLCEQEPPLNTLKKCHGLVTFELLA